MRRPGMIGTADRYRTWLLGFAGLLLVACVSGESAFSGSSPEDSAQSNQTVGCEHSGALACSVPPLRDIATGVCAYLRSCIEGRKFGDVLVEKVEDCEPPVIAAAHEFGSVAAVAARLAVDGPPSHGAYLFVHFKNGWCPADQLLEPVWNHGGYCEAQFRFRWKAGTTANEILLLVMSERICHMPLDQDEIAAGESDVAMSECLNARYRVVENGLRKLSETASDGPCPFR